MLRSFYLPALVVVLVLLSPGVASADQYLVTSCHDPGGQPNAAIGWAPEASGHGRTTNTCPANGALIIADLNSPAPSGSSSASWRFTAPPGTRIVRILGSRATFGFGAGAIAQDVAYVMTVDDKTLERCQPANDLNCAGDLSAPVDKLGLTASNVEFRVLCTDAGRACSRPVSVTVANAWVALEDALPPVVANANVADEGESSGRLRAKFDAADIGGGLYRALVKVDGKIAQAVPLGPPPCADVAPADLDPYQFNVPLPCPPLVKGAAASVDVSSLAPGPHGVEIAVEDAAGNQTTAVGPV